MDEEHRLESHVPIAELSKYLYRSAKTCHGFGVRHVTFDCHASRLSELREALRSIALREDVFRLRFSVTPDDSIECTSLANPTFDWEEVYSKQGEDSGEIADKIREWMSQALLSPRFRAIIKTPDSNSEGRADKEVTSVHFFIHHSWMDGQSVRVMLEELLDIMAGGVTGAHPTTTTPTASLHGTMQQLKDYQHCHREAAIERWSSPALAASSSQISSSTLRLLRPHTSTVTPACHMSSLQVEYPEHPESFTARTGFSFKVLVHAAWALVLCKIQNHATVAFGSLFSRRSLPINSRLDKCFGSLSTVLPVCLELVQDSTAGQLLDEVSGKLRSLNELEYSEPADGYSLGYGTCISPEEVPSSRRCSDLRAQTMPTVTLGHQATTLYFSSEDGTVRICYNRVTYHQEEEMRIISELLRLAMESLGSLSLSIRDCLVNMIPMYQKTQLLGWSNCFATGTTRQNDHDTVTSLFEKQVISDKNMLAVQCGSQKVTYSELAAMARVVAARLVSMFRPGSVILIHADGSLYWIVAMLAVQGADCVSSFQVASAPHAFRSRNYAAADGQGFIVPSADDTVETPDGCKHRLCIQTIIAEVGDLETAPASFSRPPRPLSSAYIGFTSGSTGRSKGAVIAHYSIVALVYEPLSRLQAGPGSRVVQVSSPAFDGAIYEIMSSLCSGATLVLKGESESFEHLKTGDTAFITPSIGRELDPGLYPNLKCVYFGAEILSQHTADKWAKCLPQVYNIYGPTECTMVACVKRVTAGQPVTIGKPLPSTRIYILGDDRSLLPPLVAGEICIAGVQVSLGYVSLPDENAKRFLKDPIWPSDTGLAYSTGDWGYWTLEGEIVCLGRKDRQVKLAGFRVDMDDVQATLDKALSSIASGRTAVVLVNGQLACAVSGDDDGHGDLGERLEQLAKRVLLPKSIPRVFQTTAKIPLTGFGKLDYRAVAEMINI